MISISFSWFCRMKKRPDAPRTALLTVTIFVSLLLVFLIHQITFSSIVSSASPCSKEPAPGNHMKEISRPRKQLQLKHMTSKAIKCDFSHYRYDLCYVNGSTALNPITSTLSLTDMPPDTPNQVFKLRPYPRKWENFTMARIPEITLTTTTSDTQHCDVVHSSPALVFSTGGYTGNTFHDFNEGFIPLFNTIRIVFPVDTPVVFVIANYRDWWLSKYAEIVRQFTSHPVINLDNDTNTHCFPSAAVGLISQGFMTIDPKLLTFSDFHNVLENAYSRDSNYHLPKSSKPLLVLASRTGDVGRVIRNQAQVIQLAEEVGFEVVLFEPTEHTAMSDAFHLINSSHAMLGVHGAALTHFLFLRPGAVLIQIVPIGIDWLAETCFGKPAKDMGMVYMEYKVALPESSLLEKYGLDYMESHDPDTVMRNDFAYFKETYLQCQDVTLDLERIGQYLKKAYNKIKKVHG